MVFRSVRIEIVKIVRYMRWGIMSSGGTCKGMLKSVGSRTVAVGMASIRFD